MTTLLLQQQCLIFAKEMPIFDGDPLEYHAFVKAFENGVERNTVSHSDRLYFLEQHTKGHPKKLVRSCQQIDPERGYVKANGAVWK